MSIFKTLWPEEGVALVTVSGEITGENAGTFRDTLRALTDGGECRAIVLDAGDTPYLDAGALGVIVDTVRYLRDQKGSTGVFLAAPAPFVRRTFQLTRLEKIVTLSETVEQAMTKARKLSDGAPVKITA